MKFSLGNKNCRFDAVHNCKFALMIFVRIAAYFDCFDRNAVNTLKVFLFVCTTKREESRK